MVTNEMFQKLGQELDIEPALLKSVAIVECGNELTGMLSNGEPKILFEGHIFYRELKKKDAKIAKIYLNKEPTICYEKWTKEYYLGGYAEYRRYNLAISIDPECAMLATSWGVGQIMGFNHKLCGQPSVSRFVELNRESEEEQMKLWYYFLYNSKLVEPLKQHNWEVFVRGYNGPGQVDVYSQKLINTYNNLKGKV